MYANTADALTWPGETAVASDCLQPPPFYNLARDLPGLISAADRATRDSSRFFEHKLTGEFQLTDKVLNFRSPYQGPITRTTPPEPCGVRPNRRTTAPSSLFRNGARLPAPVAACAGF
jgi:hypothetical protein